MRNCGRSGNKIKKTSQGPLKDYGKKIIPQLLEPNMKGGFWGDKQVVGEPTATNAFPRPIARSYFKV